MNKTTLKTIFLILAILIILLIPFLILTSATKQTLQPQTRIITIEKTIEKPIIQERTINHYYNYPKYKEKEYKYKKYKVIKKHYKEDYKKYYKDYEYKKPIKRTYKTPVRNYHIPENRPIRYYPVDLT